MNVKRFFINLTAAICVPATAAAEPVAAESADSIADISLQEIIVTGQSARQRVQEARLGSENLELTKLSLTPQLFGETDIIKSITLLAGVRSEADGAGGFEVRGGNPYQNLVTMDGMTLYNPAHLMGIFSTFNDDAMSRATLHKGPLPAEFGEASSSVLETAMRAGDMHDYDFSATIGLLNAKASAGGPLIKDKLSFAVAARRSYVDLFLKMVPKFSSTVMNFYDVNAKIRYDADASNRIEASFFMSRDNLAVSGIMGMHWGNIAGSINWRTRSGDSWNFTTTAATTGYSTIMSMNMMDQDSRMKEYIRSYSLNERAQWQIAENHSLSFGLRAELLRVNSCDMHTAGARLREVRSGWENAAWLEYDGRLSPRFEIIAGMRLSVFSALSGSGFHAFSAIGEPLPDFSQKTYVTPEPRGSLRFNISGCHSLIAGASLTSQNIHGLRSTATTFPFDRYALSSAGVRPEKSIIASLGYNGMTTDGIWDWSASVYWKRMLDVYDYRDGVSMFSRTSLESLILGGDGKSCGLELMLRKNIGKFSGWIAYTLSSTRTRISGINDGNWYDAGNDRRHDVAIVGMYRFNDRWNVSSSWTYSSGRPLTAPDAKYEISGTTCYYYTARNSYKTPPSHRLDLSATYTRVGRKVTSVVNFGLFNAYAHYSPFVIYFEDDPSKPSGTRAVQQSLFGLVPSVSYTIEF